MAFLRQPFHSISPAIRKTTSWRCITHSEWSRRCNCIPPPLIQQPQRLWFTAADCNALRKGCRVQTVINIHRRGRRGGGGGGRRRWRHNAPCKFKEIRLRRGKPAAEVPTPTSHTVICYNSMWAWVRRITVLFCDGENALQLREWIRFVCPLLIYDPLKW